MTDQAAVPARDQAWRHEESLEALIARAQGYGRVILRESSLYPRPAWGAEIEFETAPGIQLQAKSEFDHRTPAEALQTAIERAEKIHSQFR